MKMILWKSCYAFKKLLYRAPLTYTHFGSAKLCF